VWEEPNWHGWWDRDRDQFFETYAYFHRTLRKLDPGAVIVGPSINKYDPEYLEAFLLYSKKQDVLPDILSWHEIIEQHRPVIIPRHVAAMEEFMKANGISIRGIDINEFGSPDRQTSPGLTAMYLANLEKAKVNGACRACWMEQDGNVFNGWLPMLDGLLTRDQKPRSTWWAWKAYGDITGTLVEVVPGKGMAGVAGVDDEEKTVRILLGRNEFSPKDKAVLIRNLDKVPWLVKADGVRVIAKSIPDSGWEALEAPKIVMDETRKVNSNEISLLFPGLQANEALAIELTSPGPEDP
jgi:hypothetical protein